MPSGWSSAIHAVLNQAIKAGGSSLRDHRQTSGELGYFQHSFQVYDREGKKCESPGCGGIVRAVHPERTLDVLVPEVPEVSRLPVARMERSEIRGCEWSRIALRSIRATAIIHSPETMP